jgi:hypothetical protein
MKVSSSRKSRWSDAWPDALAFGLGLGLAWFFQWSTKDLVWSLWLSSLCVGYAMILWIVSEPLRELIGGLWLARRQNSLSGGQAAGAAGGLLLVGFGTLFGLAFFTVHFGGFHFVHSVFLSQFFPLDTASARGWPGWAMYREVFVRYWWFLPSAFLAERAAFKWSYRDPDTSVTAAAIANRKARGDTMILPYKNVIRMHLLIFFFFFAHLLKLENFLVYAVVYAVYFFPWRLLKKDAAAAQAQPLASRSGL